MFGCSWAGKGLWCCVSVYVRGDVVGKKGGDGEVVRLDQVILGAHGPWQDMTTAQKPQ